MQFKRSYLILFVMCMLCYSGARASHIVGGEFTYKYIKDTVISGGRVRAYELNLTIYQDCLTGQLDAILQDNPAFFTIYNNADTTRPVYIDSLVYWDPEKNITVPANFSNSCITNVPALCLYRKSFIRTYYLPVNEAGYTFVYQRCCRNASIVNIIDPGDKGATYFCTIPGSITNSSAIFKNYPPQIICLNNPLFYDNSATDANGDSLSYEFCPSFLGATGSNIKPLVADHPPFDTVNYFNPPYSYQNPMTGFPPIQIDPVTGLISGTPNRVGRYLVTVCCNEWRNGMLINTVKREFQFVVTDCSKVVVADVPQFSTAPNTYIVNCSDYFVHFVNTSKGGFSYHWDYGVTDRADDTSSEFEPSYNYPDSGTYQLKLIVNPGSTCPDSIVRLVKIYPRFVAAFEDTGTHCPGANIIFTDKSIASIKPITQWKWSFGDGDSSFAQNPAHSYKYGGTYNVVLITSNIKDCIDTALNQVLVQNFRAFAGNDTTIVKGETIRFDAQGGTKYAWSPGTNLSDTTIGNPLGYYPDTGMYTYKVHVESAYGCSGDTTVSVLVVNQASFLMPNAFTPNGDGLNDVFRPRAVGYRSIRSFQVFNRFGELVYSGDNIITGWDGTYNHRQADIGVYFWQISFTDRFGKEAYLKGDVTLIR